LAFQINVTVNAALAAGATARIRAELQRALSGVGGVGGLGRQFDSLAGASTASAAALNQTASAYSRVAAQAAAASAAVGRSAAATRQSAIGFTDAADAAAKFGQSVGLAARRFAAYTAAVGTIYGVVNALRSGVSEAVKFDLAVNKLAQVADDGARGVAALRSTVIGLSKSLGVSSADLAEAAVSFTQAGLNAEKSAKAVEVFAKTLLSANFGSARQTTEGMIAVYQQFGQRVDRLAEQMGAMNAVAGAFAVEAGDLVTAVQKAGGAFSTAGGSLNELLALMTAVRATTRESADQIATGLRSIFTYVQRDDTVEALKSMNINLRYTRQEAERLERTGFGANLENQFVGPYQAVLRLAKGLAGLRQTDPRYSSIVEDLGGVRQISRVLPLIQQVGVAQRALNVARLGEAQLEIQAAQRQDAVATKLTKIKEAFGELTKDLVASPGFKTLVDSLGKLSDGFASLLKNIAPVIPSLGAFALAKAAASVAPAAGGFARGLAGLPNVPTRRFAHGGPVPGSGNGDRVPSLLEPKEFVIRRRAAESIGHDELAEMNRTGRVRRYATGGRVRPPLLTASLPPVTDSFQVNESYFHQPGDPVTLGRLDSARNRGLAGYGALDARYGLAPKHRPGLRSYISQNYYAINAGLRAGKVDHLSPEEVALATGLYSSRLPGRLVGFRGIDGGGLGHIERKLGPLSRGGGGLGRTFSDKAFSSVSLDPRVALHFGGFDPGETSRTPGVVLRVTLPKATRGAFIGNEAEREFLLPPGAVYQQTGGFRTLANPLDGPGSARKYGILPVTVVGHQAKSVEWLAKRAAEIRETRRANLEAARPFLDSADDVLRSSFGFGLANLKLPLRGALSPNELGDGRALTVMADPKLGLTPGSRQNLSFAAISYLKSSFRGRALLGNTSHFDLGDTLSSQLGNPYAFLNREIANKIRRVHGLAPRFARGGPVPPHLGTPGQDSVPAYLMPDEYVLRTSSARKIGRARLDFMNQTGKIPGFADGGSVGRRPTVSPTELSRLKEYAQAVPGLNDILARLNAVRVSTGARGQQRVEQPAVRKILRDIVERETASLQTAKPLVQTVFGGNADKLANILFPQQSARADTRPSRDARAAQEAKALVEKRFGAGRAEDIFSRVANRRDGTARFEYSASAIRGIRSTAQEFAASGGQPTEDEFVRNALKKGRRLDRNYAKRDNQSALIRDAAPAIGGRSSTNPADEVINRVGGQQEAELVRRKNEDVAKAAAFRAEAAAKRAQVVVTQPVGSGGTKSMRQIVAERKARQAELEATRAQLGEQFGVFQGGTRNQASVIGQAVAFAKLNKAATDVAGGFNRVKAALGAAGAQPTPTLILNDGTAIRVGGGRTAALQSPILPAGGSGGKAPPPPPKAPGGAGAPDPDPYGVNGLGFGLRGPLGGPARSPGAPNPYLLGIPTAPRPNPNLALGTPGFGGAGSVGTGAGRSTGYLTLPPPAPAFNPNVALGYALSGGPPGMTGGGPPNPFLLGVPAARPANQPVTAAALAAAAAAGLPEQKGKGTSFFRGANIPRTMGLGYVGGPGPDAAGVEAAFRATQPPPPRRFRRSDDGAVVFSAFGATYGGGQKESGGFAFGAPIPAGRPPGPSVYAVVPDTRPTDDRFYGAQGAGRPRAAAAEARATRAAAVAGVVGASGESRADRRARRRDLERQLLESQRRRIEAREASIARESARRAAGGLTPLTAAERGTFLAGGYSQSVATPGVLPPTAGDTERESRLARSRGQVRFGTFADAGAEAALGRRGVNFDALAPAVAASIRQDEVEAQKRRLAQAIERQLRVVEKDGDAGTRMARAQELAAQAYASNARVLTDTKGNPIGLPQLGQQIQGGQDNRGAIRRYIGGQVDEAGRDRFSRFADRLTGGVGAPGAGDAAGPRTALGRAAARTRGFFGGLASNPTGLAYAGSFALPVLGERVRATDAGIQNAAQTGNVGGVTTANAVASGAQGAGVGLAVAAAFGLGPVGLALTALGTAAAFAGKSFQETAQQVADARLGQTLQGLSVQLDAAGRSGRGLAGADGGALTRGIADVRRAATAKAAADANSTFTFDPQAFGVALQRETRTALAPKAGPAIQLLSDEAVRLGRQRPDATADTIKDVLGRGVAGELARLVADVRGVPLAKVLTELADTAKEAQQAFEVEKDLDNMARAAQRVGASFDRLALAATNAAQSTAAAETGADVRRLAFGQGGTVQIASRADSLSALGAQNPAEFRQGLQVIRNALGGAAAGFTDRAEAADRVARVGPDVIRQLLESGTGAAGGVGPEQRARELLEQSLFPALRGVTDDRTRQAAFAADPATKEAMDFLLGEITSSLRKNRDTDAFKDLRGDQAGFVDSRFRESTFGQGILRGAQGFAQQINQFGNKLVSGLAEARQFQTQTDEARGRVDDLSLLAARYDADRRAGGEGGGRFLSLQQLLAPDAARQATLLRGTGLANDNAQGIADRLAARREELQGLAQRRDAAQGDPARSVVLTREFEAVAAEADRLQQALRNLADPTQRLAAIQERLAALNADREGRLGFAERFTNADPQERLRLARGQRLAAGLNRDPSGFDRLSSPDRRLALEGLRLVGNTRFRNTGLSGNQLAERVLGRTGVLNRGDEAERDQLVGRRADEARGAAAAQDLLAQGLQTENNRFLAQLEQIQRQFFDRLAANAVELQVREADTRRTAAAGDEGRLRGQAGDRDLLRSVGIRTQDDLTNARRLATSGAIDRVAELSRPAVFDRDAVEASVGRAAGANVGAVESFGAAGGFGSANAFRTSRFVGTILGDTDEFRSLGDESRQRVLADVSRRLQGRNLGRTAGALRGAISRTFSDVLADQSGYIDRDRATARAGAAAEFGGTAVDPNRVAALSPAQRAQLARALGTGFTPTAGAARPFETFDADLRDAAARTRTLTAEFETLRDRLADLNVGLAGGVPAAVAGVGGTVGGAVAGYFSSGGAVHGMRPRGTDTVPAMLSPEEFVVNPASSRANRALLHHINNSRGPVRLAYDGGRPRPGDERPPVREEERYPDGLYLAGGGAAPRLDRYQARNRAERLYQLQRAGAPEGVVDTPALAAERDARLERIRASLERSGYDQEGRRLAPADPVAAAVQGVAGAAGAAGRAAAGYRAAQNAAAEAAQRAYYARASALALSDPNGQAGLQLLAARNGGRLPAAAGYRRQVRSLMFQQALSGLGQEAAAGRVGAREQADFARFAQFRRGLPRFAAGGLIPGYGGGDTTPLLARGGEFILNRNAVDAIGATTLSRYNSNPATAGDAGRPGGGDGGVGALLAGFASAAGPLASALTTFGDAARQLGEALAKFPSTVQHTHSISANVVLNDGGALAGLKEGQQEWVMGYVQQAIAAEFSRRLPDAPGGSYPTG